MSVKQSRRNGKHDGDFDKAGRGEDVEGFYSPMKGTPQHAVICDITLVFDLLGPLFIHIQRALESCFCILLELRPLEPVLSQTLRFDISTERDAIFIRACRLHIQRRVCLQGKSQLFRFRNSRTECVSRSPSGLESVHITAYKSMHVVLELG